MVFEFTFGAFEAFEGLFEFRFAEFDLFGKFFNYGQLIIKTFFCTIAITLYTLMTSYA